ncbi:hypothetical protein ACFWPQ_13180 [Streptomyces sp. NPDC058464]|uniref:hypothetical protein n=1 Tax=Streptomyces sp. NPDC058464 TaxID=3346511 RepID=UPI00366918C3
MTDVTNNTNICGICGAQLDEEHSHEEEDPGIQVRYKVIKIRGILADSIAVDDPGDQHPLPTRVLATNLGVDANSLLGIQYTCLVSSDPYGTTRFDYRLGED